MIGKRPRALGSITQIQKHEHPLVFRKAKDLCRVVRVKAVQPAAIDAHSLGCQQHVGGHNGRVLRAGIVDPAGIGVDRVLVKGHHKHHRRAVAAGGKGIDLSKTFRRTDDINFLLLEILCRRSKPPRFQNLGKDLLRHRPGVIALAGIPLGNQRQIIHLGYLLVFCFIISSFGGKCNASSTQAFGRQKNCSFSVLFSMGKLFEINDRLAHLSKRCAGG